MSDKALELGLAERKIRQRFQTHGDMARIDDILAALLRPHVQEWISVEEREPPKDGREVLLQVKYRAGIPNGKLVGHWQRGGHCIEDHPPIDAGWYFWNGIMFDKASEPTHWQPLPPAPVERKEK